jgi:hypothetical protein
VLRSVQFNKLRERQVSRRVSADIFACGIVFVIAKEMELLQDSGHGGLL